MKYAARSLIVSLLSLVIAIEIYAAPAPQPRAKLQRDAAGKVTSVETKPAPPVDEPTVLEKMTVKDVKIPAPPRPLEESTGKYFSVQQGGPFYERSGKRFTVSVGLWHHKDEFADDSRFKPAATHALFDLLRIKW